jgi:hypothetical protein
MVIQLGLLVGRTLNHLQQGKILLSLKLCGMMKILEPSMNAYQISGLLWLDNLQIKLKEWYQSLQIHFILNLILVTLYTKFASLKPKVDFYMFLLEHLFQQYYWERQSQKQMSILRRLKINQV